MVTRGKSAGQNYVGEPAQSMLVLTNLVCAHQVRSRYGEIQISLFRFAIAILLASTQPIMAQGTSGSTGAVASIPGSVVRGHEQAPGSSAS